MASEHRPEQQRPLSESDLGTFSSTVSSGVYEADDEPGIEQEGAGRFASEDHGVVNERERTDPFEAAKAELLRLCRADESVRRAAEIVIEGSEAAAKKVAFLQRHLSHLVDMERAREEELLDLRGELDTARARLVLVLEEGDGAATAQIIADLQAEVTQAQGDADAFFDMIQPLQLALRQAVEAQQELEQQFRRVAEEVSAEVATLRDAAADLRMQRAEVSGEQHRCHELLGQFKAEVDAQRQVLADIDAAQERFDSAHAQWLQAQQAAADDDAVDADAAGVQRHPPILESAPVLEGRESGPGVETFVVHGDASAATKRLADANSAVAAPDNKGGAAKLAESERTASTTATALCSECGASSTRQDEHDALRPEARQAELQAHVTELSAETTRREQRLEELNAFMDRERSALEQDCSAKQAAAEAARDAAEAQALESAKSAARAEREAGEARAAAEEARDAAVRRAAEAERERDGLEAEARKLRRQLLQLEPADAVGAQQKTLLVDGPCSSLLSDRLSDSESRSAPGEACREGGAAHRAGSLTAAALTVRKRSSSGAPRLEAGSERRAVSEPDANSTRIGQDSPHARGESAGVPSARVAALERELAEQRAAAQAANAVVANLSQQLVGLLGDRLSGGEALARSLHRRISSSTRGQNRLTPETSAASFSFGRDDARLLAPGPAQLTSAESPDSAPFHPAEPHSALLRQSPLLSPPCAAAVELSAGHLVTPRFAAAKLNEVRSVEQCAAAQPDYTLPAAWGPAALGSPSDVSPARPWRASLAPSDQSTEVSQHTSAVAFTTPSSPALTHGGGLRPEPSGFSDSLRSGQARLLASPHSRDAVHARAPSTATECQSWYAAMESPGSVGTRRPASDCRLQSECSSPSLRGAVTSPRPLTQSDAHLLRSMPPYMQMWAPPSLRAALAGSPMPGTTQMRTI